MGIMTGRADYGDATTVGLIDDLADMLQKAEELDALIFRRLKLEQHKAYEDLIPDLGDALAGYTKLREYATRWQAQLDAEGT